MRIIVSTGALRRALTTAPALQKHWGNGAHDVQLLLRWIAVTEPSLDDIRSTGVLMSDAGDRIPDTVELRFARAALLATARDGNNRPVRGPALHSTSVVALDLLQISIDGAHYPPFPKAKK